MKNILLYFIILYICMASFLSGQKPCPGTATVTYEGKTYNTVLIGKQCWLKENLDVGTIIKWPQTMTKNNVLEKYCLNNDPANCTTYGGLYTWAEAVQYKNGADSATGANPPLKGKIQGICPKGWHIPNQMEADQLAQFVNRNGNALKAVGMGAGATAGTNTTGFSALTYTAYPRDPDNAFFWNSDEGYRAELAYSYYITGNYFYSRISHYKYQRFAVRCVKD